MKRLIQLIPKGSVVLAATSFLSYALGLGRDHFFAQTFGATRLLDTYNAAFLVPDLFFNILIAGGIAAAFIPVLTGLWHSDRARGDEYANAVITASTGTMALSAIIIVIFAKPISVVVAPGFDAEGRELVIRILRILAFSPILFAASNAIGAMLVSQRRFFFYGLSPVLYNLGIIFGTLFLAPRFGILGVAAGTLFGAFLHLAVRIGDAWRQGFRFRAASAFRTPEFRKTIRLMIPKMFGHPIELATFWGFTAIASALAPGSVTVLSFARNFQSVPVSLIGITIATTTFPLLAGAVTERSAALFWKSLRHSFFLISVSSALAALLLFLVRQPLIRIFLGGGNFDQEAVARTAAALGVFCLSIPTEALVHLLARSFYATKNTTIPVVVSILGILVALPGGYLLSAQYGILALPFAFFAGSLIELVILLAILPLRISKLEARSEMA